MLSISVYISAFILEGLGSYISIIGLSSKSSYILMALAITLDFAKIIIASVLYRNWKELNFLFKAFLVPVLFFLITITSYGAYAFLIQEFGKTTSNQVQISNQIEDLLKEREKHEKRKLSIDQQISEISPQFSTQKRRLMESFSTEINYLNTRIQELDKEIPSLKQNLIKDTSQAGTMGSLSKAWGVPPDQAAKYLSLMLVIVIDPLAVVLLMVGNFLSLQKQNSTLEQKKSLFEHNKSSPKETNSEELPPQTAGIYSTVVDRAEIDKDIKTIDELVTTKKSEEQQTTVTQTPVDKIKIDDKWVPATNISSSNPKSESKPTTIGEKWERSNPKVTETHPLDDILESLGDKSPKIFSKDEKN